jgi:HlyD family secretion protein
MTRAIVVVPGSQMGGGPDRRCGSATGGCWIALLLLVASQVAGCGARSDDTGHSPRPPERIHGVGFIEPSSEVRRLGFEHGGRIAESSLQPGVVVAAGTLLARQESTEDVAALRTAEAEVSLAEAELAHLRSGAHPGEILRLREEAAAAIEAVGQARRTLERQEALARSAAERRADLEDAAIGLRIAESRERASSGALDEAIHRVRETAVAAASRRVEVARARAAAAAARVSARELRAPVAGTVLDVMVRAGDLVPEGTEHPTILFGDLGRLRVRAEVTETEVLAVRTGARAVLRGPCLRGASLVGVVEGLKPIMGPKTLFSRAAAERRDLDTLEVFIALPEGSQFPIGLEVDVEIEPAPVGGADSSRPKP